MARTGGRLVLLWALAILGCSDGSPAGGGGGTGGHAGAAGSMMPSGAGGAAGQTGGAGRGGVDGSGVGGAIGGGSGAGGGAIGGASGAAGSAGSGTGGAAGTGGTGGATGNGGAAGTGGAAGQAGSGGAPGDSGLAVSPSAATFAATLVEAVSASQTFMVRNDGNATTTLAAAFDGTNAADFVITANGCGATIDVGASCEIKVAFAPKTRSGSRSGRLTLTTPRGVATASLSATALPSLGLLAGVLGGGTGNVDGIGPAAHFRYPSGIATDGAGNLFVADSYNYSVRKIVIATGAVTTLATNIPQPVGVVADGAGNVFVTSDSNAFVRKISVATGTVTTLAGAPDLSYPRGMAYDGAGNLYVTAAAHAVQKIVIATGAVSTIVAPYGSSPEDYATSAPFIVADGAGNLFVDEGTQIQKVVIATGAVTTLMDSTGAPVPPGPLASDGAGNLLMWNNGPIQKFVIATGAVTTLTDGTGNPINAPSGWFVADAAGNLYVLGSDSTIWKVAIASGAITSIAGGPVHTGSADGVRAAARFNRPSGIVSDGAGNVYVADSSNYTIRKIVVATGTVTTFAGAAGVAGTVDGTGAAARFAAPGALVLDGTGNLFVADDNRIRKIVLATGEVTALVGVPGPGGSRDGTGTSAYFFGPAGMAADGAGNLYVSDGANTIRKVVVATRVVTTIAGTTGTWGRTDGTGANALFDGPFGVALDGAGNLYVADLGNHTIRKVVIATRVVTTPGWVGIGASAPYGGPRNLALDGAGNLYVNDFTSNVFTSAIRKVALDTGTVSTVIGSFDSVGVSLGALPASLCSVAGITVLPTGELALVATDENSILIGHL